MNDTELFTEHRRSSRVPLKITIDIETEVEVRTCTGETMIVNLHGALIHSTLPLKKGEHITIHVYLTGKSSKATVVNDRGAAEHNYGVELAEPRNIWGVPLPPADWTEEQHH